MLFQRCLRTLSAVVVGSAALSCAIDAVEPPHESLNARRDYDRHDPGHFLGVPPPSMIELAAFTGCFEIQLPRVANMGHRVPTGTMTVHLLSDVAGQDRKNHMKATFQPPSPHPATWYVDGGKAHFGWSTGFAGYQFVLEQGDSQYSVTARYLSDTQITEPWQAAVATRKPCSGPK